MKHFNFIFSLIFLALGFNVVRAKEPSNKKSQFEVGIENTRLVFGKYTYNNHITAKLNVSLYSEKISLQYIRGTVGYKTGFNFVNLSGEYFFGSAFNGNYFNTGAVIKADAMFVKRLLIDAQLAPWYDSGYGYNTCFEAKLGCKITNHITIKAGYTTIPQYRMSERRILGGFDFSTPHLYVSPYLSIGTGEKSGGKNIRVLFDFGYKF